SIAPPAPRWQAQWGRTDRTLSSCPCLILARPRDSATSDLKVALAVRRAQAPTGWEMEGKAMTRFNDLRSLVQIIGPRFADGADERDGGDIFVGEHFDVLREHRVFSALVPADLGGGGVRHSEMCAFLRELAHHCPRRR